MGKREGDRKRRLELLQQKIGLEEEQGRVARAIAETDAELGVTMPTPLDAVRIATPCHARWEEMAGDARRRFCPPCGKEVFNLSAMTRAEADDFLATRFGRNACIRLFFRADGTVITSDCTKGKARATKRRLAVVAGVVASAAAFAGASALSSTTAEEYPRGATHVSTGLGVSAEHEAANQAVYK